MGLSTITPFKEAAGSLACAEHVKERENASGARLAVRVGGRGALAAHLDLALIGVCEDNSRNLRERVSSIGKEADQSAESRRAL